MSRRWSYKQEPGFFPFCAPEGFRHQDQAVDIVDIYHKYNNPDKRYIFTLRETLETFELSEGTTALHGYELGGISYTQNYNVGDIITLQGIKRWIIIESNTITRCALYDIYGKVGIDIAYFNVYEWCYCGRYINEIVFGSPGLGYYGAGSVKYAHTELKSQITTIGYCSFYFCSQLEGVLNIPDGIIEIGHNSLPDSNYGTVFAGCTKITRVIIPKSVEFIGKTSFGDNGGFGKLTSVSRFDIYTLVAPFVPDAAFSNYAVQLHIKPTATGYDVYPWNDRTIFSHIIRDL